MRMHNPPHPGRVLREYLGTRSVTDTAKHLGVTRVALSRILNGSAGISADMALKLADALGTSPELWFGTFGSGAKAEFHGEISAALSPAICCFYDTAQFGGTTAISIRAPHAIDSYSVRI